MADYTLNWSDAALKAPFTIVGGAINTSLTSLSLMGQYSSGWDEALQEDIMHLLEHFASSTTAPSNPTIGQLWFQVGPPMQLKMYAGPDDWVVVWPQSGSSTSSTSSTSSSVGQQWVIRTSETWTVPDTGQYSVVVIGAGGGGTPSTVDSSYYYSSSYYYYYSSYGAISKTAGTAGNGGDVSSTTLTLNGSDAVSVTIGLGGDGVNGGLSSFGVYVTALGGLYGGGTSSNGEAYGYGGAGGVPDLSTTTPDAGSAGDDGAVIITRLS